MLQFAMAHEVICFIVALSFIWACERVITAFINRNKASCMFDCNKCNPECEDDEAAEEVVAMGGEEED